MDVLLARRRLLKSKLTRLVNKIEGQQENTWDVHSAKLYDEQIQELWPEFNDLFDEIFSTCSEAEEEGHQTVHAELADRFDAAKLKIRRIVHELTEPLQEPPASNRRPAGDRIQSEVTIKLPKMDIPTFNGDILEWTSFCDLFTSTVHEHPTLKGSQKLKYLKNSVSGEAAELIKSIPISDANYSEAWQMLTKRYKDNRKLIYSHLGRFMELPNLKTESGIELRRLVDTATSVVRALKALERPMGDDNDLAIYIITSRLDTETHKLWETKVGREHVPNLTELLDFLDERAAILHTSEFGKEKHPTNQQKQGGASSNKKAAVHQTSTDGACSICKKGIHPIYSCEEFRNAPVAERRANARKLSYCFNCLRPGHSAEKCYSTSTCKKCKGKHNTLLHLDQPTAATAKTECETISAHTATHSGETKRALLATAIVNITDVFGQVQQVRALMDPGADVSCISERCVQNLGIPRRRSEIQFSGLGANSVGRSRGIVQITLGSRTDAKFHIDVDAYVLGKVTEDLPKLPCSLDDISHFMKLPLADPHFHKPGAIDLLLGADVFFATLRSGQLTAGKHLPVAHETTWGWIVGGECQSQNFISASVNLVRCEDSNLDEILTKFWKTEEIPNKVIMTAEEKACEDHFIRTTTRGSDGKYIVELPFKEDHPPLGASRDIAIKRLKQMERSMRFKPDRWKQYVAFMREYQELGHMERVPSEDLLKPDHEVCYLPHHAVIKESSTSTKLRVVFDASSKTSSGNSLNDSLMVGPKYQDDMFVVLIRFRGYIIAFVADVCKMFRMIWLALKHRDFQRVVWRESPEQPIEDFRMTTVTFGESSAPHQAKRVMKQAAEDGRNQYPLGSEVVKRDPYMDDILSGAFSIEEAKAAAHETLKLLKSVGMELRKWSSNSEELLETIDPSMREIQTPFSIDEDDMIKTLGLHWLPGPDVFWFKVNVPPGRAVITKRSLSSDTSKVFDPLGLISPTTVLGKIMMQKLWSFKQDWDEPVPESIDQEWRKYRSELPELEKIKIPRCVTPFHDTSYELIGFSDASEIASAAVVYTRSKDTGGNYVIRIVAAKTKLAPLQQKSLPRLELIGALLLARLMEAVSEAFILKPDAMHAFTDSTVVLAWLQNHPKRWCTFVANRVSEIQDTLPECHWYHVPGTQNPADCASRGIPPSELVSHPLWWEGPKFLIDADFQFSKPNIIPEDALLEERKIVNINHVITDNELLYRFSSLTKLQRITAYCKRFAKNCRLHRKQRNSSFLTSEELNDALLTWVKIVQQNVFPEEIQHCISKETCSVRSRLRNLNPFVDESGLLRVGGRLRHSKLAHAQKFPIILPTNHVLTRLIIFSEHINTLHGGCQMVLASIQRKFWIINARNTARREIRKCVTCVRMKAQTTTQMMSDLPPVRVTPNPAFLKVGVDFTGPYTLRVLKGRGNRNYKGYIAIFICMVTRAIHLEIVSGLSSEAFIAALKRFVGRRRLPSDLFSDCGRNFVGANKELRALWKSAGFNAEVGTYLAGEAINWHFNPPGSPHFGGLWEAGIKSVKFHLQRVMGNIVFNYEEMQTVMVQIEACLNSRPLTPISSDPNDLTALTPGHFLTGDALRAIPERDLIDEPVSITQRFKLQQKVAQQFWKRWSREFLTRLQQRPKWLSQRPNLQVGDLVLVKDERLPPLKWKLARILEAHPGADGITRVFTIKTTDGELKRPLVKLCPLPIDAADK